MEKVKLCYKKHQDMKMTASCKFYLMQGPKSILEAHLKLHCRLASAGLNEDIVRTLSDPGADVNAPRGINGTALEVAVSRGCSKVVEMLLDAGAEQNGIRRDVVSSKPTSGSTFEHSRAYMGRRYTVRSIIIYLC